MPTASRTPSQFFISPTPLYKPSPAAICKQILNISLPPHSSDSPAQSAHPSRSIEMLFSAFHALFCSSLNINHTDSERPKSFRGDGVHRSARPTAVCRVGRALLWAPPPTPGGGGVGPQRGAAPPQGPGAFINGACIIEPFLVREQVQPNRELPTAKTFSDPTEKSAAYCDGRSTNSGLMCRS